MKNFLEFHSISKSFPGVKALHNVSFELGEGEVHGLMGENGAGKSTLIKILSGVYTPDNGFVSIDGDKKSISTPLEAINEKISVIQQELQLALDLTVAENIMLGNYSSSGKIVNWKKLFKEAREFLDENNIHIDEKVKVSTLTIGQQQMVEIAKALKQEAKIIAFDEPTSSLSKVESDLLFGIIRKLKSQQKVIIYISHRMNEIFELCDACTILRDGQWVITYNEHNKSEMNRENIIKNMTGKTLDGFFEYRTRELGDTILKTENLKGYKISKPVSINVKKGEVVGLFGLVGAGRSELARLIFGADARVGGTVVIDNIAVDNNLRYSIKNGIAFCSEDRKRDGIIMGRPLWENINLSCRESFNLLKTIINFKAENDNASKQVNKLGIRTPSIYQNVNNLSGGNQQKVVLARWLSKENLKLLIVDEPTRGIDIGAKNEIYNIIYDLAESGLGVLMISSELPEIMGVCDRVYVMREGYVSAELTRNEFTEEKILEYAFPVEEI